MGCASITGHLVGAEPRSSSAWARSMRLTGAFMTLCVLAACSQGRQAPLATPMLSYNGSHPFPAVIGESMALTPAVSGTIGHYTVSPPLPPGLSLDGQSGVISGTPTQASASATYLVNASGAGVRASFPLVLSVTEPPNHLSYPSPAAGTVGMSLGPLVPTVAGTVEHYAVTPALPPGVALDSKSGVIAGTPSAASSLAPYTITASSLPGNTSFILLLTVAAPSSRSGH
jgi:Putative Ig domain